MIARTLLLMTAMACAACGGPKDSDSGAVPAGSAPLDDVALAVSVARGVEANPAAADSVVAAHGLTRAALDSLMIRIAGDSALSAQYTARR